MTFHADQPLSRRRLLQAASCGFGYVALAGVCAQTAAGAATVTPTPANPLAPRAPHFAPRAKRVVFLFMQGGPSQVDTFDPKPELQKRDGEELPFHVARTRQVSKQKLLKSPWSFARHGDCGRWVSELLPHTARHVDDLCVIRSMHTEGVAHGPATLTLHTGATNLIRPSVGAWVGYGLGTENENLPAFVTINPPTNMGGPRNYASAFLPAVYQGTAVGRAGRPAGRRPRHRSSTWPAKAKTPPSGAGSTCSNPSTASRPPSPATTASWKPPSSPSSSPSACRPRPPACSTSPASPPPPKNSTASASSPPDDFGRQCLLARRLSEASVRYVQVNYSDNGNNPKWDQHTGLPNHAEHARATDQPVAALLTDLKSRGLLEDTLVWWGGEFGRTPFAENRDGRDHNPTGFTVWLAGGGVKPGLVYGHTDDFGHAAVEDKVHMHDLHATVLHLLGLDHTQLTYRYAGRDFRLTDVYGEVVKEILA